MAAREARYYWPGGRPHRVAFRVVARAAEIPLLPQRASRYKYKYNHGSMEMVSAFSPMILGRDIWNPNLEEDFFRLSEPASRR